MNSTEAAPSPQANDPAPEANQQTLDAAALRADTQRHIDQARANIAEGRSGVIMSDSQGVVETPRESAEVARGNEEAR